MLTGIIKTVSAYDFERAFADYGRKDQFTYEGKLALYEHLCELSDDMGAPIELDVIALCCEFTEYENLEEYSEQYGHEYGSWREIDGVVIGVGLQGAIVQSQ